MNILDTFDTINGKKLSKPKIAKILNSNPQCVLDLVKGGVSLKYIWKLRDIIPNSVFNVLINDKYNIFSDSSLLLPYIKENQEELKNLKQYIYPYIHANDNKIYKSYFLQYIQVIDNLELDLFLSRTYHTKSEIISSLTREELKSVLNKVQSPEQLMHICKCNTLSMSMTEILNYIDFPNKFKTLYINNIKSLYYYMSSFINLFASYISTFDIVQMHLETYDKCIQELKEENEIVDSNLPKNDLDALGKIINNISFSEENVTFLIKHNLLFNSRLFNSVLFSSPQLKKDSIYSNIWTVLHTNTIDLNQESLINCIKNGDDRLLIQFLTYSQAKCLIAYPAVIEVIIEKMAHSNYIRITSLQQDIARILTIELLKRKVFIYMPNNKDLYIEYIKNNDLHPMFVQVIADNDLDLVRSVTNKQAVDYIEKYILNDSTMTSYCKLNNIESTIKSKPICIFEIVLLGKLNENQLKQFTDRCKLLFKITNVPNHVIKLETYKDILQYLYKIGYINETLFNFLSILDYSEVSNYINTAKHSNNIKSNTINKDALNKLFSTDIDKEFNLKDYQIDINDIFEE